MAERFYFERPSAARKKDIIEYLNEAMLRFGGHIGYGIRPSERRKGYNKINLSEFEEI